jgi:ribosomal protein L11 methyltransferase
MSTQSRTSLWKAEASTAINQAADPFEFLSNFFEGKVAAYTDLEAQTVTFTVYLTDLNTWKRSLPLLCKAWNDEMSGPFPSFKVSRVRRQDWAESWKRHFKPICISRRLWVRPSWERVLLKKGQVEVVLDPGLSFGTGQHPTTAFCLEETIRLRGSARRQAYLDIGTGSGILAIAAARLGYSPIIAFDLDAEAVRIAKQNARKNGVGRRIRFGLRDVRELETHHSVYAVVCANLVSNLILENADRILERVEQGGVFIAAGILGHEFESVQQALASRGWELIRTRGQREWRSGSFRQSA